MDASGEVVLDDGLVQVVEDLVDDASLTVVAGEMAMPLRIIPRRLAESGTSFEEILDSVRRSLAWQHTGTGMQATSPLGDGHTAVDNDRLAGHVAASLRGEPNQRC